MYGSGALVHAAAAGIGIYHQLIDAELLVDSADHNCLVYGLVIAADKVAVEISIQVVHVLSHTAADQRQKYYPRRRYAPAGSGCTPGEAGCDRSWSA